MTGQRCVPWTQPSGIQVTVCIFSYDLVSEVCATEVDEHGKGPTIWCKLIVDE